MKNHLVVHDCGESVKATLESYWSKKLPRLEKLLVPYRPDLQDVRLTVHRHEQNPQRAWYEGRAVIHLPTGTLVAEASDKEPRIVLDRLADTLAREIKRHKEHVRKDYVFKRKKRARADLSAAGPLLERDREVGRREDFFQLLRPLLGFLRDHARRELRILELEGVLHRNEVSAADVLDEVLSRAWEQFADRPKHLALDLWLTGLLHEVLSAWVKQEPRPHASLAERAPEGTVSGGEQEWWAALLGYDDAFTLDDLVPGSAGTEVWDELAGEEQRRQLLALVAELPTPQRQAFLLHALEDYDPAEIAMLQDRPESQVRADIEAARKALKERLVAGGQAGETGQPTATAVTKGD
jgi:DNA-directed RNA polymerase specialized sigma24 family protein/ribosome-associated translation inhibitor RaiA